MLWKQGNSKWITEQQPVLGCWLILLHTSIFLLEMQLCLKKTKQKKNPNNPYSPLLYQILTEMRNHTRKSILKLLCTHPSQFHITNGEFPQDKHPSHQQPHQKALAMCSHMYWKVPLRVWSGVWGEGTAAPARTPVWLAFFGALEDLRLATPH